jgi:hypothetical protein
VRGWPHGRPSRYGPPHRLSFNTNLASWSAALRATDNPDTVDGIDHASGTWWHVYDEWGLDLGRSPGGTNALVDLIRAL